MNGSFKAPANRLWTDPPTMHALANRPAVHWLRGIQISEVHHTGILASTWKVHFSFRTCSNPAGRWGGPVMGFVDGKELSIMAPGIKGVWTEKAGEQFHRRRGLGQGWALFTPALSKKRDHRKVKLKIRFDCCIEKLTLLLNQAHSRLLRFLIKFASRTHFLLRRETRGRGIPFWYNYCQNNFFVTLTSVVTAKIYFQFLGVIAKIN